MGKIQKHLGSCHCGAVKYEVELDASSGSRCNCSICTKIGQLGSIVKPARFKLLTSEGQLSFYEWGGKVSKRYFCKTCGIHVYGAGHLAEIGGDFVSVNLITLDDIDPADVTVTHWDGRHDNWEAGTRDRPWPIRSETSRRSPRETRTPIG